ncbi:MAG: M15 family metallopeptidase [Oscillospiraceae bacterium]|nr:M15 family metallopeptidase [Oscillospiraceae bacterium]
MTEVRDGQYFDSRAAEELLEMISGAEEAGYTVTIRTGYRPYATQAYIFFGKASQIAWDGTVEYADAEELARKTVAYPGTSEHQLGLAVDLMDSASTAMVAEDVEELPVLLWLQEHCAEYGFIYRYPKEKQEITGWYEPWHFRYVGKAAATYIMENDLCLEEFIELY